MPLVKHPVYDRVMSFRTKNNRLTAALQGSAVLYLENKENFGRIIEKVRP